MNTTIEPDAYHQLLADIDRYAEVLRKRFAVEITCHLGCTGCCQQHLSVFDVEADALRELLGRLPSATRERLRDRARAALAREADLADVPPPLATEFPPNPETTVPCPALVDGACSVYDARPVICRTHGFPLLYVDEEAQEALLDVCPLNFSESPDDLEALTENDLFEMNIINERLARANIEHVKTTTGDVRNAARRRSIAEIILSVE